MVTTLTAAAFFAEEARDFSDGGVLADLAWLIPVVPLVAAGLIMLIGKRLRYQGYELAVGSLAFVALYGVVLFVMNMSEGIVHEGAHLFVVIHDQNLDLIARRIRHHAGIPGVGAALPQGTQSVGFARTKCGGEEAQKS